MSLERIIRPFESAGLAYPFMPAGYVETEMANVRLELGKGGGTVVNLLSAGQQTHGSVMDETERETGTRPEVKAPPKPNADDEAQPVAQSDDVNQLPMPYNYPTIEYSGTIENLDANGNPVMDADGKTTQGGILVPPGPVFNAEGGGPYALPGSVGSGAGGGGGGGWSEGSAGGW